MFAHADKLGLPGMTQQIGVAQPVVQDDLGASQQLGTPQREESWVPWARTDQINTTAHRPHCAHCLPTLDSRIDSGQQATGSPYYATDKTQFPSPFVSSQMTSLTSKHDAKHRQRKENDSAKTSLVDSRIAPLAAACDPRFVVSVMRSNRVIPLRLSPSFGLLRSRSIRLPAAI